MFYVEISRIISIVVLFLMVLGIVLGTYGFKKNKDNFFITGLVFLLISVSVGLVLVAVPTYNDEDIKMGARWNKCELLETNKFNGSFSENVNVIKCDGIVENIPITVYNQFTKLALEK